MSIALGTRLSFSSHRCSVLYSGPVEGTTGTWLGVEWDDPSRGKHSGSHNGVHYFTTRYLPPNPFSYLSNPLEPSSLCAREYVSNNYMVLIVVFPALGPSSAPPKKLTPQLPSSNRSTKNIPPRPMNTKIFSLNQAENKSK